MRWEWPRWQGVGSLLSHHGHEDYEDVDEDMQGSEYGVCGGE